MRFLSAVVAADSGRFRVPRNAGGPIQGSRATGTGLAAKELVAELGRALETSSMVQAIARPVVIVCAALLAACGTAEPEGAPAGSAGAAGSGGAATSDGHDARAGGAAEDVASQGGGGVSTTGGEPAGGGGTLVAGSQDSGGTTFDSAATVASDASANTEAGTDSSGQSPSDAGARAETSPGEGSDCAGLICEDFESGKIDTEKWDLVAKGGTLTVQEARAAHGKFAAQVHGVSGSADDWALLVAKKVPAGLKTSSTFGRMYFYAVPDALASIHVQMAFAGRTGSGSATGPAPFSKLRYMEVASYSGRWQLGFDLLDLSPLVEEVSYSSGRIPSAKWACMEWQFDDSPDHITSWIDGAESSTFDSSNVGYASPGPAPKPGGALWNGMSSGIIGSSFDTFGIGFHDWHPQRAFDIYYDDLVLDSKRVGCLK